MVDGVQGATEGLGARGSALALGEYPVLFYDARCGVCRRFIRMAIHADRRGQLRIAPLQGPLGEQLRQVFPQFAKRQSAVWVDQDDPPSGFSDAILSTLDYLGGRWRVLARVGRVIPRFARDWAYRTFARNRPHMGRLGLAELDELSRSRLIPEASPNDPDGEVRTVRLDASKTLNPSGP